MLFRSILFLTTIFFNEKYYVHNILRNTFTTKFMWKVVTSSNLNPPLKLFFYLPILINSNLLFKIYCKNIVVVFFNYDFLFFILFFFLSFHFHPYKFHFFFSFFFFLFFSSTQVSNLYPPFFYFLFHLKNIPATSPFTSHQRRERERERGERLLLVRRPITDGDRGRRKDKAGGDRRSPCSTTTSSARPPPHH